jgi:hypothetical protein
LGEIAGRAACPSAAVFRQETDQPRHGIEVRRVNDETSLLARLNKVCVGQVFQVKRKAGRGKTELLANFASGHTFRASHDQHAKDCQARFMG